MRISFCVIFDSKRSIAMSLSKARTVRENLQDAGVGGSLLLPIVPYRAVKHLQIYDANDIHAGFCIFKKRG